MVEVILAGYNVDADVIRDVNAGIAGLDAVLRKIEGDTHDPELIKELVIRAQELTQIEPEMFSPEVVPAAYARISRDPRPLPELRRDGRMDVKAARKSNGNIIFKMGHKSVGNHANFNFDIMSISRLAIEWLEARRIGAGYTEKSQRYITMEGDYVIPKELSPEDAERFRDLVENVQNRFYLDNVDALMAQQHRNHRELADIARRKQEKGVDDSMNTELNKLNGWGKEDARYSLGLATEAQVGTTFSATTLEHAIRTMKYSPLAEVRELAQKLFDETKEVAPSLILYTDAEIFQRSFKGATLEDGNFRDTLAHMRSVVDGLWERIGDDLPAFIVGRDGPCTRTLDYESCPDVNAFIGSSADANTLAAIIFSQSRRSLRDCYRAVGYLYDTETAADFMRDVKRYITLFDNPPRHFEVDDGLVFEIRASASNHAQLKRHRMMTLISQPYDTELDITVPESIKEAGLEPALREVCEKSAALYHEFREKYGEDVASYCLTNAHRRRELVSINPREMNHLARQRCDSHAQWDIRSCAHQMVEYAKELNPLSHMLCCGKDEFGDLHDEVYCTEE